MPQPNSIPAPAGRSTLIRGGETGAPRLRRDAASAREAGQLQRARRLYRRLLEVAPDDADALHWLGALEFRLGRPDAARAHLQQAVRLAPNAAQPRFHLAEVLRACDAQDDALEHYRVASRHAPNVADIWFGFGTALLALDRPAEAVDCLRRAQGLAPVDAAIGALLRSAMAEAACVDADRLRREGEHRAALEGYRHAIELAPDHARAWNNLGACLEQTGAQAEALNAYRHASELDPELAEAELNLGIALAVSGDRAAAKAALLRALSLAPTLGVAHYHLALLDDMAALDSAMIDQLEAFAADPELDQKNRSHIGFALARRLDHAGFYDRAFGHLARANVLRQEVEPFDAEAHRTLVEQQVTRLDRSFFKARAASGVRSDLPILVVGMPRSGTTLVEQILAAHPAVHGAGERDDLREISKDLVQGSGKASMAAALEEMPPEQAIELGHRYVEALADGAGEAHRVVDKMPGNYLRLGLVGLLSPRARVIWCRREPLDTCLSCFFQDFAHGLRFTYDLEALGMVYRLHERLLHHWQAALPNRIHEVIYEDLVAEPERETRRLVDFVGLDWRPNCLTFATSQRSIRTASLWQARQPIYRDSVGRWRAYAHHLEPLRKALAL